MDLEPVFTRYANDADFNAKVQAAFEAVEASPYTTVKHAVIAIALHAALPPEPEPLKAGDTVRILPDPYIYTSGGITERCKELKAGEKRTVKDPNPEHNLGNISVEPYWIIAPECVEKVES